MENKSETMLDVISYLTTIIVKTSRKREKQALVEFHQMLIITNLVTIHQIAVTKLLETIVQTTITAAEVLVPEVRVAEVVLLLDQAPVRVLHDQAEEIKNPFHFNQNL